MTDLLPQDATGSAEWKGTLTGHVGPVRSAAFSPHTFSEAATLESDVVGNPILRSMVATAGMDKAVKVGEAKLNSGHFVTRAGQGRERSWQSGSFCKVN